MSDNHLLPEDTARTAYLKDLLHWHESLKRCNPAFAKRFIMEKLRPLGVIDDLGTHWLIIALALGAV